MTICLPDVNVWIALAAEGHFHHVPARKWFSAQPAASVAFCRITQMGLLRLLTNPAVMGRAPRTIAQAWEVYTELRSDRRLLFVGEPEGLEAAWRNTVTLPGVGPSSWSDAYLAAFAQTHSYSLITFDSGFGRWADLKQTLLAMSAAPHPL